MGVSYQGTELYKFEELYSHLLIPSPDHEKSDLTEVLDKSGMFELEVEFNPSSEANVNIKNGKIELQDGTYIPSKIRSSDLSFRRWFQQVCSLLGSMVHLIPDTNVSRRLYYTNYLRNIVIENASQMMIALSRLVILEIERKYNNNNPGEGEPPDTASQKEKDSYPQRAKEIRIAFQSMGEILSMKNDGAKVLPASEMSLIRSFPSEAGKRNADALIRREIINSRAHLVGNTRTSEGNIKTSSIAFLTCDLMNSLAAIAEDLNTIYFYRLEGSRQPNHIGHDRLSWLIFNTAIHFGECDVIIKGKENERRLKCKGIWSGKSVYDWQNNIILVESAT